MSGVICLRCKQVECVCVEQAANHLENVMQQAALELEQLPEEVQQVLRQLSPAQMAVTILNAHQLMETLQVERDHFFNELQKAGRVLACIAIDNGGRFEVPLVDELIGTSLEFEVGDKSVSVWLEQAVPPSEEVDRGEG